MIRPAAIAAAGVAYSRFQRAIKTQTRMIGAARRGASAIALIGARHSENSTPASIALASAGGMAATARPNGRTNPAATSSAATTTKAPTAAGKPPATARVEASSAAPGVDQAAEIGIRDQKLSAMPA